MEKEEELQALEPIPRTFYNHNIDSTLGVLVDQTGKRKAGGRVQFGYMPFEELAETLITHEAGFDKQNKRKYDSKEYALERVLSEYGIPRFEGAILIAGVRKYHQDPNDGFIPLAPGTIDVEAGLEPDGPWVHRELTVYGVPNLAHDVLQEAIIGQTDESGNVIKPGMVGFVTEYGNGDSLEILVPMYTPGRWIEIQDIEFHRPTGAVIVTPRHELWSEGLTINNTHPYTFAYRTPPFPSVKMEEAVKIARQLARDIDLK